MMEMEKSEFDVGFWIAKCTHEYRIEYSMQAFMHYALCEQTHECITATNYVPQHTHWTNYVFIYSPIPFRLDLLFSFGLLVSFVEYDFEFKCDIYLRSIFCFFRSVGFMFGCI